MAMICYQPKRFAAKTLDLISTANTIINEYLQQGFMLTLRQLYYQLVARDIIPNTQKEYKRVGSVFNDARLAGLMDWSAIEDRTRNLSSRASWDSASDILEASASQFRLPIWNSQPVYIECWIEKEALAGVFQSACHDLRIPFFSCRGYVSQSEMHAAAQRLKRKARAGKQVVIMHFGDHDPSGIDMTRDIKDRLALFGARLDVERLALNMDQVEAHEPPPNPAKTTDSRYDGYIQAFGDESWELDALEPALLSRIVNDHASDLIDEDAWQAIIDQEEEAKQRLQEIADNWDD